MNIKRIFLDVDDVLVDFTLAALSYTTGYSIDENDFNPEWGFDIVKAHNELSHPSEDEITIEVFWRKFNRNFWAFRQKADDCDTIIEASYDLVGKENVFLLTAPLQDPESAAGKMELIRDMFPVFWRDRRYMIAPPKYACAYPGALLIDDSDKNVNEFRTAGGQAALVPQPWNSEHARSGEPLSFTGLL